MPNKINDAILSERLLCVDVTAQHHIGHTLHILQPLHQ